VKGSLGDLRPLMAASEDQHADAMRALKDPLQELVQTHHDQEGTGTDPETAVANRRFADEHRARVQRSLAGTALAAAGGGLLVSLLASPAYGASSADIQMLQTAASLEVLVLNTYKTALSLPYIGGASAYKVLTTFLTTTVGQHAQHLTAFNAALTAVGAKAQTNPDPAFVPVVNRALLGLASVTPGQGVAAVVALAIELEQTAAETYVNDCSLLSDKKSVALFASIMGIEAQHVSVLLAVQSLLAGGTPQFIELTPTNVASLPAATGKAGIPNAFSPVNGAAPAGQGAAS
jgi:hypothetical protein